MEYGSPRPIGDILKDRNIEIIGADPVTRHGFTQVPNFVLTKKDLSVGGKLAYAMLLKYAWGEDACFPGQSKLADDMGSGERSVRRYLDEHGERDRLAVRRPRRTDRRRGQARELRRLAAIHPAAVQLGGAAGVTDVEEFSGLRGLNRIRLRDRRVRQRLASSIVLASRTGIRT